MFKSVEIKGFRGLQDFAMDSLGRINLLVGTNNSGKSSILEALELLSSRGSLRALWKATGRRGERLWYEDDNRRYTESDVSHLFWGHSFQAGSRIDVSSQTDIGREHVSVEIVPWMQEFTDLSSEQAASQTSEPLGLRIEWHNGKSESFTNESLADVRLSPRGGLSNRNFARGASENIDIAPVQFISTAALSSEEVLSLFDEVVLTPEEDLLVEALRTIEPNIDRIAAVGSDRAKYSTGSRQGNIVVKLSNHRDRIPIGSMGDGIWRMLGIALSLVNAKNGILLIDEVDTGLHYSVMSNMWNLLKTTAERLNIQVFATTHSRDCYESLASISRDDVSNDSCVTIQRVDRGLKHATSFTEQEIVAASERGVEVR